MDFFDAFLLRDAQVLFHTAFDRMEQAGEIPYPNPDLGTMARMAASTARDEDAHPPHIQHRKPPVARRGPSATDQRRTRRYALALTAILVLLIIVALSSTVLLKTRLTVMDQPPLQVTESLQPSVPIPDKTPESPPGTSAMLTSAKTPLGEERPTPRTTSRKPKRRPRR
jgi:hypothetical protein